jgi:GntR family histidine utilization transcriptional repressor
MNRPKPATENAAPRSGSPPQALYRRLKRYILDRIGSGEWPPETRLPSEIQLAEEFGVSRMTANRALRELSAEGYLLRLQGVGTFVADHRPQAALLEVRNIAEEIAEWGGRHSSVVHLLAEERAAAHAAAAMGLEPGAKVFHSIIVHKDRGRPMQLSDRFVNPAVAPHYLEQDFGVTTPNEYLTRVAPIQEAEHVIEAVLPDAVTRRLLDVPANEPCLLVHRRTWSFGQVATRNRLIYPGSRYRLGGRFRSPSMVGPLW